MTLRSSAVEIVLRYCRLQARLVAAFLEEKRPGDLETLRDVVPRVGTLDFEGQSWSYVRHGVGVAFEFGRLRVDAHRGMAGWPDGVDAWRLAQYLERLGTTFVAYDGQDYPVDDERAVHALLLSLAAREILVPVGSYEIFRPVKGWGTE